MEKYLLHPTILRSLFWRIMINDKKFCFYARHLFWLSERIKKPASNSVPSVSRRGANLFPFRLILKWLLISLFVFFPFTSFAHALSPLFYPVGIIPFRLCNEYSIFLFIIPCNLIAILAGLFFWSRELGFKNLLTYSFIFYFISMGFQTASYIGICAVFDINTGWSPYLWENLLHLTLILTAGTLAVLLVAHLHFRKMQIKLRKISLIVTTTSLFAYLCSLAVSYLIFLAIKFFN